MDFKAMMKAEKAKANAQAKRGNDLALHEEIGSYHRPMVHDLGNNIKYCGDFLTKREASSLVEAIDKVPSSEWNSLTKRRLLNLGGVPHPSGSWSEPLPQEIVGVVSKRLVDLGLFANHPNQALLNEYVGGDGIDAHKDGPCFEELVGIVNLESDAMLEFYDFDSEEGAAESGAEAKVVASVVLRQNSLVVFSGDAYSRWHHGIPSTLSVKIPTTVVNAESAGAEIGSVLTRNPRRLSLTLRRLAKVDRQIEEFDVLSPEIEAERARRRTWWLQSISEKH